MVETDAVQVECYSKRQGIVYMFLQRDFKEYESNIWNEYESIFIFFVTLSSENGQLLCENGTFYDEDMINLIIGNKYSTLLKVFVCQAPQATKAPRTLPETESDGREYRFGVPAGANFFVVKRSFERDESPYENGSFFLKVFCQYLENIGNGTSLFNIMTAVLSTLKASRIRVAERPRNNVLPEVSSTPLKTMYLRSKGKTTFDFSRYKAKPAFGKTIVFNLAFPNSPELARDGTEEDVKAIEKCFRSIGFNVEVYNDLMADDIRRTIDKGSNCRKRSCTGPEQCGPRHLEDAPPDYSNDTCVAVVIMSHGDHNYFNTTTEDMKIMDVIIRLITTDKNEEREDLYGKPKLFFLQMCRESQEPDLMNLPLECDDTLVFHSTYHGNKSYRLPSPRGSPFIQGLCEKINQFPEGVSMSLTDFLHEVQESVVHTLGQKQMPIIYSTQTKHLFIQKLKSK